MNLTQSSAPHSAPAPSPRVKSGPLMIDLGSSVQFALLYAGLLLLAFNQRFWLQAAGLFWHGNFSDALFLAALALLLWLSYAAALLLVPGRLPLKTVAAVLCPLGAMAAYCADSYGVVIDTGMIRNVGATDSRELRGLLSPRLLVYSIGLGVVPVFLVARCRIAPASWRTALRQRLRFMVFGLALALPLCLAFAPRLQVLQQQRQLHYLSVPGAALASAAAYLRMELAAPPDEARLAAAHATSRLPPPPGARPLLVFLVIGETARHASFQLGGYPRPTNPRLSGTGNLYYFSHARACATSTAVSVPCMLSPLGRERYVGGDDARPPNVLEALAAAGAAVAWRSNNTAGFDPGAGVARLGLPAGAGPGLCNEESCLDEILLAGLEQHLMRATGDSLLALHQMGSHGPAYHLRYPPEHETFRPACTRRDVAACAPDALRNAYDNTIRYTDHVLAELIAVLGRASHRYDTALLYVSDHGESLGENGVFLHSAPYHLAPPEQTRVPFMLWMSDGYAGRFGIDASCLRKRLALPVGHDHVYHTLLGMMAARNADYRDARDVLAACRGEQP